MENIKQIHTLKLIPCLFDLLLNTEDTRTNFVIKVIHILGLIISKRIPVHSYLTNNDQPLLALAVNLTSPNQDVRLTTIQCLAYLSLQVITKTKHNK